MTSPLRILQVTPALESGGVERTTIEVAEAVAQAGGTALVASAGGRLEAELERAGGELIRMDMASKNPLAILANADRLAHLIAARDVSLIHARSRAPAWSALIAARRAKLPFVTTYHGTYSEGFPGKRWYNSVMARGDIVIANSNFTRARILQTYKVDPARVVTIPRGVDLDAFAPARIPANRAQELRAAWGASEGKLVALVLARLSRWKGQDLLIEAAARVEAEGPGRVTYILAGGAQGREDVAAMLDSAIARHGLESVVKRVGHVDDVPGALTAADFAIFPPTQEEAFGRGAVEAQAMGVPVIAANAGGFTETVLPGETGLLFTKGDADALAGAIRRLIAMPAEERRAMGQAGAAFVRTRFTKANLQAATLEIYRTLLHDGPP
jgi:glycosyltransferase involved in cell wall biosynthesis